jgi:hypothetical protein
MCAPYEAFGNSSVCKVQATNYQEDGNGSAIFLDRQNIQCPNNGLMNQFHLNRNEEGDKMRYNNCRVGRMQMSANTAMQLPS